MYDLLKKNGMFKIIRVITYLFFLSILFTNSNLWLYQPNIMDTNTIVEVPNISPKLLIASFLIMKLGQIME